MYSLSCQGLDEKMSNSGAEYREKQLLAELNNELNPRLSSFLVLRFVSNTSNESLLILEEF